jgi:iron complex transport system ATP-binding protein
MGMAVQNLDFAFGERAVLRSVSADFPDASLTAVLGPNGAGKSTLLRLLLGVLTPQRGQVQKDSRPLDDFSRHERAATMAYVPQASQVAFPFSVSEVVRLGRYTASRGNDSPAIASALARMDIADRAQDSFGQLSAGQQQRVTVARALAQLDSRNVHNGNPKASRILLADEPVSAMDPSHALRTMDLFESLANEGMCVIVVLHDLSLVLRYAKHVLILGADGQVAGQGDTTATLTPTLLRQVYGVSFRAIHDPETNRPAALLPRRDV